MLRTASLASLLGLMVFALTGCSDTGVDVSSNGGQVVVSHAGALWVADVEKEDWRKVPLEGTSAGSPSWSPDGRYVLFELQPPAQETASSDQTQGSPAAQPQKPEPAYAALFDTQTETTTRLAPDVGPPFAWRSDSKGFVALQSDADSSKIAWFGIDGTTSHAVPLPKSDAAVTRLTWLPGSEEVAFVALHSEQDSLRSVLYRTEGDQIHSLTEAEDVAGIGSDSEHGRLLWARSWSDPQGLHMALYSYDPSSHAVTRLNFPESLSFIHPETGYTASVESVVFAPNARRMAILVAAAQEPKGQEDLPHTRRACYSAETDASGARLIQQTDPDSGNLYPAWSHDGQRLVILDSSGESPRLFVYNYDGTGKRMAPLPNEQEKTSAAR